jgi:hypothetical protein
MHFFTWLYVYNKMASVKSMLNIMNLKINAFKLEANEKYWTGFECILVYKFDSRAAVSFAIVNIHVRGQG